MTMSASKTPVNVCPGHARVKGSTITNGLRLGISEMLRSLRHYIRAQCRAQHAIDRLEEGGVDRGGARRSSLKG